MFCAHRTGLVIYQTCFFLMVEAMKHGQRYRIHSHLGGMAHCKIACRTLAIQELQSETLNFQVGNPCLARANTKYATIADSGRSLCSHEGQGLYRLNIQADSFSLKESHQTQSDLLSLPIQA